MIHLPPQISESFVPIASGLFVSLVNKYILNNPKLDACCTVIETEVEEIESDDSMKTEASDTLSGNSGNTTATLPIPHPVHHYVHSN